MDGAEANHQDQEETTQLHPNDLGQLEDEKEPHRDRCVGEGSAPKCKKLKMHSHNLPIQFPSMLFTNHFDNLIRRREVQNIPRAQMQRGKTVGVPATMRFYRHNNILACWCTLINQINQLMEMVVKHIQACDKKPPPPSKDQA
ncbi:hypothetical protein CFC21_106786 [Triticum aestivum]|uniref:Uncharacterized protein n=2 Tax=Triticum aestivum TaxID=4565 RepID=A0A9R1MES4_WHEAT|nr:hypothetical protein CFC21_106779 [Triticum aestivum]KAF7106021.1 hypothetical protein CFC21_106786 [Triticum aestivum]